MSETFFICQAIFDVMVVLYLVADKFIQKRQKVTFLTLMDMAKNLMEKERILAEKLKSEMENYKKDRQKTGGKNGRKHRQNNATHQRENRQRI